MFGQLIDTGRSGRGIVEFMVDKGVMLMTALPDYEKGLVRRENLLLLENSNWRFLTSILFVKIGSFSFFFLNLALLTDHSVSLQVAQYQLLERTQLKIQFYCETKLD